MNEAFEIERAALLPHRLPIEAQLDDIVALDKLGCERACDEKVPRIVGAAHADMAVSVHHILVREDAIGHDKLLNDGVETAHVLLTPGVTHPPLRTLVGWNEEIIHRNGRSDQRLINEIGDEGFQRRPVGFDAVWPRIAIEQLVNLVDVAHQERRHVA